MTDKTTPRRVLRIGTVSSDRPDKTAVVRVERRVMHPRYKKYVKLYTTLHAHDEKNEAKKGDLVEIAFTRPISKTKRWRLVRIVEAARVKEPAVEGEPS